MSSHGSSSAAAVDPFTRNALRYTVSAREYQLLQQYLLSHPPSSKAKSSSQTRENGPPHPDDYNAATIRATSRVFLATFAGLKLYDFVLSKLASKVATEVPVKVKVPFLRSPNFRLAASLSSILFFHRILHRFFLRLRESLRTDEAKPFRRRNPRVAKALTSKLAAPVGASLAGLFLGISPAQQTRLTITIYALSRSLEFLYNSLDERGALFKKKPWWFGSWLLMPFAMGQLLHAFVFDRDCFPTAYGSFILKRSPQYIALRPDDYPAHLKWPGTFDIVDSLGALSKLKWPAFISPIMFPHLKSLPASAAAVAPITDPANPVIERLSCAILHPNDPSCSRTYLSYYIQAFPAMAKFWTLIYAALAIPQYRAFADSPLTSLNGLAQRILRTSFFLTSAIGTAWGSICLWQYLLPRSVAPTSRWFLSGFLAGLWAFLERNHGRSNFLYTTRASMDSLWKVGKKHRWWRGVKNGDVVLFVASLMLANIVYERNPKAVSGGAIRKSLSMLRGEGWVDRAKLIELKKAEAAKKAAAVAESGLPKEE